MRLDHLLSERKEKYERCNFTCRPNALDFDSFFFIFGGIAQLARASALQAGGPGFESLCLQYLVFLQIIEKGHKNNMVK